MARAAGPIEVAVAGPILRLTLTGTRLDQAAAQQITSLLAPEQIRPGIRVVVLDCGGPDFCRGLSNDFEPLGCGFDPAAAIARVRRPVVACLRGEVASAGLELALAADIRLAADDAVLSLPDLLDGRLPCWGGTQRLVRLAGPGLATAMLLSGHRVSADQAQVAGLVHEIVERDTLAPHADDVASELARLAPLALELAKEAISEGAHLPMLDALRLETDLNVLLQSSRDRQEGLEAFLTKRDATFTGD